MIIFKRNASSSVLKSRITKKNSDLKPLVLITSIGNPSPSYDGTRHSVGHHMLDLHFKANDISKEIKLGNYTYKISPGNQGIVYYKLDKGYMNLSGKPLSKVWSNFVSTVKGKRNPVLVVLHDELDLNLGTLKVRKQNSSHKGHNGLRSIHECLGKGYNAVQIGIGRNYPGADKKSRAPDVVAKYVLGKFNAQELDILEQVTLGKLEKVFEEMTETEKYIYDSL